LLIAKYPAAITGLATGVSDIQKRLEQQSKDCPDEKFALAGYSQGGVVVIMAAAKLPADITKKVLAVVLYGAGNGTAIKGELKDRTIANCAPGDFVSLHHYTDQLISRERMLICQPFRHARTRVRVPDTFLITTKEPSGMIDLRNTLCRLLLASPWGRSSRDLRRLPCRCCYTVQQQAGSEQLLLGLFDSF
jgi:pimeloyl-ACP methyl ester carboxylesterase